MGRKEILINFINILDNIYSKNLLILTITKWLFNINVDKINIDIKINEENKIIINNMSTHEYVMDLYNNKKIDFEYLETILFYDN